MNIDFTLQDILRNSQMGIWKEHPVSTKCFWSNNLYRMLSDEKATLPPTLSSISLHIEPMYKVRFADFVNRMKSNDTQDSHPLLFKYKGPRSSTKFLLIYGEPVYDKKGKTKFWQGTISDITSFAQAMEKQQYSLEVIRSLLNNSPILVLAIDSLGNISFYNKTYEEITGLKHSEIVGNREALKQLFPDIEQRRWLLSQLKEFSSKSVRFEQVIYRKKGGERTVSWVISRSYFAENQDNSFVLFGSDITKKRQMEQVVERNARTYEILSQSAKSLFGLSIEVNIFQSLGIMLEKYVKRSYFIICKFEPKEEFFTIEGVFGFTKGGWQQALDIIGWNPLGRRFQFLPEQINNIGKNELVLIEKNVYEFTDGLVSSVASRALERQLSIEKIYTQGFFADEKLLGGLIVLTQGDESEMELSIIEGLVSQATIAIRRRSTEMQLLAAKSDAEEVGNLKSNFLANFSHEIRTPLNGIIGFTQLLKIPNLSKEKRLQYVDIINSKGKMLVKLINDMIDVSKVDTGQLTIVKSYFNLNALMKSIKSFYDSERVFQHREAVEIILSIPSPSETFDFYSDEGRLEQVFTNLLDNALKFTDKGYIEFGYKTIDNGINFFVKDTGVGIDETMHKLIFDRYKQVEENIVRTQEGKGLGLAISKGIVELLGGEIWVKSSFGNGAVFNFTIPLSKYIEEIPEKEGVAEAAISYPDWKNKILLVAEDEEINYLYLTELLHPTGVNIVWARDGSQAVELVGSIKNINAILMDIRMPNMNGYAATLEIRQINPEIPIVAQTAFAFAEDRARAQAAGCNQFIAKPINIQELFKILDGYLG